MAGDDATSVSREAPAPVEGGDELEGPVLEPHRDVPSGDIRAAEQPGHEEEGGGETMASTGNGSAASKAASATSRVWGLRASVLYHFCTTQ